MRTVPAQQLRAIAETIFQAAGAPAPIASAVTDALILANLLGHDSHGVWLIPDYVAAAKAGRVVPAAEPVVVTSKAATVLVDGKRGFGQVAGRFATDQAIAAAKEFGAAAVGVINCNHVGRVGEYPERAAARGVLLFATCGNVRSPMVRPHGGRAGTLGTNPVAFGLPAGERAPMIVDFATSVVAAGKVAVARDKGVELPPGALVDKEGQPSIDPNDFYDGGALLTFGGHKGYGLALVAAIMSQGLTGALPLGEQRPGGGGFFLWAVDTGAFTPTDEFGQRVDSMIDRVKAVPPAEGFDEVLVPGEPERRERERRERSGVPVAETTWEALQRTARELGVAERVSQLA